MYMFPGRAFSFLMGLWAALSTAVANRLSRHPLRAALLSGMLVSLWPQVEMRLQRQPLYQRGVMLWLRMVSAVYSFQQRRHRDEHEREREEMIERYGFDPTTGRPREPETLLRVIPMGQSVRLENATLTMLNIESYADGLIIHARLLTDDEPEQVNPFDPSSEHSYPEPGALTVRDDRGHQYPVMPGGGGGGSREWRFEFRSHESVDPHARELVLELPHIRWETFTQAGGRPTAEKMLTGPWTFQVSL